MQSSINTAHSWQGGQQKHLGPPNVHKFANNHEIVGDDQRMGNHQKIRQQGIVGHFVNKHGQFTSDQGDISPIDETATEEDPMEFWRQTLHALPSSTPIESMTGRQHEYTQINYPSGFIHHSQRNIPQKNALKSIEEWLHENLPNQTTKNSSLSLVSTSPENYLKSSNMVGGPSAEPADYTGLDNS